MKRWMAERAATLLIDLNNTPLADGSEMVKLDLILTALQESSVELFHNAAERSRQDIEESKKPKIKLKLPEMQSKPKKKIILKSSCIRRIDDH